MNKKQFLTTMLATLLTVNTLSACTSLNASTPEQSSDTSIEEIEKTEFPKYLIDERQANTVLNEDGTISYEIPKSLKETGCIIYGENCYRVFELINNKSYIEVLDIKECQEIVEDYLNALNAVEILTEDYDYRISTIDISNFYNENGEALYYLPKQFIEVEGKYYKVEKIINKAYDAAIKYLPDGTKEYIGYRGCMISGTQEIVRALEPVSNDEALTVINNYLDNNSLKLQ